MTQNKVELAEKLSKESHQGQKYGSHDYFDYHIKGVVNSLIEQGLNLWRYVQEYAVQPC